MDLSNYRRSYEKNQLLETTVPKNPLELFQDWFQYAEQNETFEPNAMSLATIGIDGFPKSRIVLLKSFSDKGFVFYTNYGSEKGKAIAQNNNVALSFFWPNSERQVIIKGTATKIDKKDSEAYFYSRPLDSQIGAIVSNQSEIIPDRIVLEAQKEALENDTSLVKMPENWGGYLVAPISLEFWQGRKSRLHDRIRFAKSQSNEYKIERLAP